MISVAGVGGWLEGVRPAAGSGNAVREVAGVCRGGARPFWTRTGGGWGAGVSVDGPFRAAGIVASAPRVDIAVFD
jgi:hypothetical protein